MVLRQRLRAVGSFFKSLLVFIFCKVYDAVAESTEQDIPSGTEVLRRYTVLGKLAQGGMAEVYLARQIGPAGYQKVVVIKRVRPHLAMDPDFVAMFVNEARLAAMINHPNVVQIFDLGQEKRDWLLAMEFLDGRDMLQIGRTCRQYNKAVPFDVSARILADACNALDYAHRLRGADGTPLNLVHRDMSPENILVTFEGQVKVVDFGIAKAADNALRTQAGQIKGKLGYVAPEAILGKGIDGRADIFAIGATMYLFLCGRPAFTGQTPLDVFERSLKPPEPPSHINPHVPRELERICMRCLSQNLDQRYATAGQVRDDIENYLVSTKRPLGAAQLSQFMRVLFSAGPDPIQQRIDNLLTQPARTPVVFPQPLMQPTAPATAKPVAKPAPQPVLQPIQPVLQPVLQPVAPRQPTPNPTPVPTAMPTATPTAIPTAPRVPVMPATMSATASTAAATKPVVKPAPPLPNPMIKSPIRDEWLIGNSKPTSEHISPFDPRFDSRLSSDLEGKLDSKDFMAPARQSQPPHTDVETTTITPPPLPPDALRAPAQPAATSSANQLKNEVTVVTEGLIVEESGLIDFPEDFGEKTAKFELNIDDLDIEDSLRQFEVNIRINDPHTDGQNVEHDVGQDTDSPDIHSTFSNFRADTLAIVTGQAIDDRSKNDDKSLPPRGDSAVGHAAHSIPPMKTALILQPAPLVDLDSNVDQQIEDSLERLFGAGTTASEAASPTTQQPNTALLNSDDPTPPLSRGLPAETHDSAIDTTVAAAHGHKPIEAPASMRQQHDAHRTDDHADDLRSVEEPAADILEVGDSVIEQLPSSSEAEPFNPSMEAPSILMPPPISSKMTTNQPLGHLVDREVDDNSITASVPRLRTFNPFLDISLDNPPAKGSRAVAAPLVSTENDSIHADIAADTANSLSTKDLLEHDRAMAAIEQAQRSLEQERLKEREHALGHTHTQSHAQNNAVNTTSNFFEGLDDATQDIGRLPSRDVSAAYARSTQTNNTDTAANQRALTTSNTGGYSQGPSLIGSGSFHSIVNNSNGAGRVRNEAPGLAARVGMFAFGMILGLLVIVGALYAFGLLDPLFNKDNPTRNRRSNVPAADVGTPSNVPNSVPNNVPSSAPNGVQNGVPVAPTEAGTTGTTGTAGTTTKPKTAPR